MIDIEKAIEEQFDNIELLPLVRGEKGDKQWAQH